jgi:hypothetical protein
LANGRPRLNSRLEAEGAEFLVLGYLLLEGIHATKAYTRYPGFDVIAVNPRVGRTGRTCKIQVKSRWATDYDHKFVLKENLDCDFVVFAELNRGYRDYHHRDKSVPADAGKQPPRIFVFPANKLNSLIKVSSGWSKVALADIPRYESYKDRWDLIRKFLKMPPVAAPQEG